MNWGRDLFEEMYRMQKDIDRLFNLAGSSHELDTPMIGYADSKNKELPAKAGQQLFRAPKTEVYETEKSVIANIELPGADKKDIELNVTDDEIEVKVEKKQEKETKDQKKGTYSYMSSTSSFYRSIPLNRKVAAENATAEYKNGMLRVEVPKKQKDKKKLIDIK